MTDPEIARIAAGLTDAHFAALERRFTWKSEADQEAGEADLYRLGLWEDQRARGRMRVCVTERGRKALAVRLHLQEQSK